MVADEGGLLLDPPRGRPSLQPGTFSLSRVSLVSASRPARSSMRCVCSQTPRVRSSLSSVFWCRGSCMPAGQPDRQRLFPWCAFGGQASLGPVRGQDIVQVPPAGGDPGRGPRGSPVGGSKTGILLGGDGQVIPDSATRAAAAIVEVGVLCRYICTHSGSGAVRLVWVMESVMVELRTGPGCLRWHGCGVACFQQQVTLIGLVGPYPGPAALVLRQATGH